MTFYPNVKIRMQHEKNDKECILVGYKRSSVCDLFIF